MEASSKSAGSTAEEWREVLEKDLMACLLLDPSNASVVEPSILANRKFRKAVQALREMQIDPDADLRAQIVNHSNDFSLLEALEGLFVASAIHFPVTLEALRALPMPNPTPGRFSIGDLLQFDPKLDDTVLLGNRYLCQSGAMLLVGQTGVGKSSFAMQLAVTLALGKPFFGIKPPRPLSFLLMQAENDRGDLAEALQGVLQGLGIDRDDAETIALLEERLEVREDYRRTGLEFVKHVREILKEKPRDIVIADPLLSFLGDDVSDQKAISVFCRNLINPILKETGAAWIFTHHTGKPSKEKQADSDSAYMGIGSSELANWARAIMVLQRQATQDEDRKVYKLILAKRGDRAGVCREDGTRAQSIMLQHSQKGIAWELSDWQPDGRGRGSSNATKFETKYSVEEMRKHYNRNAQKSDNIERIAEAVGCSQKTVVRRWEKIIKEPKQEDLEL